ncbi:bifunctional aminoglycoside phosphotransferase/ATP-binding protein [Bythopirellula polymerisocia]|uniref:Chromatin associated protein KTI12 n=1 Tax=Bythopirellula polymerisocia TaxID=2528003 RepID=A0A5C6CP17_9BACT|nr:AAA family ATPase [Bythopirellula polymerisocia]TWU24796.1 Chromatin associated protein KTI12 [Bythopirellula polymerisocia]
MLTTHCSSVAIEGVVRLLSSPSVYDDDSAEVEVIETHLSYVFLSRLHALKIKKPVHFEFVDFTTIGLRKDACEEEVRLNRRWADDVYYGVFPVTKEMNGQLAFDGAGLPVEWAVSMRRLRKEDSLDLLICERRLTANQEQTLADHLVAKTMQLPQGEISPTDYVAKVRTQQQANTQSLLRHAGNNEHHRILRVHSALANFLWTQREVFETRVANGRVVEGHGDLRPEHIYMESPPQIIDGIEFSRALRTLDILDELCFLEVECERIGGHRLSAAIDEAYQHHFDDRPPKGLVAFYKAYRATVRAKVEALRLSQIQNVVDKALLRDLRNHLVYADFYAQQLGRPWIIVVCGLMGTGKSTLARSIAEAAGADLLQTDVIRKLLIGTCETPASYGGGNYRQLLRQQVYDRLLKDAADALDSGRSVIADGTFLTNSLRQDLFAIARSRMAPILFVRCKTPRVNTISRLQKRNESSESESEARPDLYDQQAAEEEKFNSAYPAVEIPTIDPVHHQVETVRREFKAVVS